MPYSPLTAVLTLPVTFWPAGTVPLATPTTLVTSAPRVSAPVPLMTLPEAVSAVSSVTEAVSGLASGAVSVIWMTRSLLRVSPAKSVTETWKRSRTESSPLE
ncbi:hypothetical protein ACAE110713_09225 [Achromobacter aegrifaciens]|nr:hypothetical protein LMG26852_05343 [Achromobacter aegrifaciens]